MRRRRYCAWHGNRLAPYARIAPHRALMLLEGYPRHTRVSPCRACGACARRRLAPGRRRLIIFAAHIAARTRALRGRLQREGGGLCLCAHGYATPEHARGWRVLPCAQRLCGRKAAAISLRGMGRRRARCGEHLNIYHLSPRRYINARQAGCAAVLLAVPGISYAWPCRSAVRRARLAAVTMAGTSWQTRMPRLARAWRQSSSLGLCASREADRSRPACRCYLGRYSNISACRCLPYLAIIALTSLDACAAITCAAI